MAEPQVIEGTTEEITTLLNGGAFAGRKLRVIVDPDEEEDLSENLPAPPNTIRDRAHLEELLYEGLASPREEITDQEWTELRQELAERLAKRNRQ